MAVFMRAVGGLSGLGLAGCGCLSRQMGVLASQDPTKAQSIYEFTAKSLEGEEINFEKYRNKVLVVVNVASNWGLTKLNYTQLVSMYNKYKDEVDGFEILAFPCNQFGGQEPGSPEEIRKFVDNFGVKFQMFEKIDVNGKNTHPVFEYLKSKQGGILGSAIKWNFTKFLVDKQGQPIKRYGSTTSPIPQIEKDVIEELAK